MSLSVMGEWRKAAPPHNMERSKWPQVPVDQSLKVNVAGKNPDAKLGPLQTWNSGDIDFESDGSVFIRNPYLANAIEEHIRINSEKLKAWEADKKNGLIPDDASKPFLFRLTRDEGWSGEKQNVVC